MADCVYEFGYGADSALSEQVKIGIVAVHESGVGMCTGAVDVAELILQDLQRFGKGGVGEDRRRLHCMSGADGTIGLGFN